MSDRQGVRTEEAPPEKALAEGDGEGRRRLWRALRYCLGVFVGVRVGLSVLALAATALLPALEAVDAPGWPAPPLEPGWHNLVTAWERFDALWFLRVAAGGYVNGDGSAAFFPLYPLLIRALSPVFGGPLASALVVSNMAFLAALVVLYRLSASEHDEAVARRTVLYVSIFPTAFFFLAPYSESLFLLLVVSSLMAARRGRWALAGIAGVLASATRGVGIVLVPALAVEAFHRRREHGESLAGPLTWSLAAAVGTAGYLFFWWRLSGDWLAPFHQQATWQRQATLPWETIVSGTREAIRWPGVYPGGYHMVDWLIVVPALAAGVWVALRSRPVFSVYAWASLLAPMVLVFPGRPFMSLPRFLLTIFPLFWVPAVLSRHRRWLHEAVVVASAAGLGLLTALFVDWYYVF